MASLSGPSLPEEEGKAPRTSTHSKGSSRSQEGDVLIPSAYERFLYNRPCCAWLLILGGALALTFGAAGMLRGGRLEFTTGAVWDVLGDIAVQRWDAFRTAKDGISDFKWGSGVTKERSEGSWGSIVIVYEVTEGNIFDSAIMDKVMQMEATLVGDPQWAEYCQLIYDAEGGSPRCTGGQTVLKHYKPGRSIQSSDLDEGYGPCDGSEAVALDCKSEAHAGLTVGDQPCTSKVYHPATATAASQPPEVDPNYTETLRCMCCAADEVCADDFDSACSNSEMDFCGLSIREIRRDFRNRHIGKGACGDGSAKMLRSFYSLGTLFTSTENAEDVEEMMDSVQEWTRGDLFSAVMEKRSELVDENFNIHIFGAGIERAFMMSALRRDQVLAIGSVAVVFIWIWTGTSSVFLAACGMAEIVLSIPLAMFVWGAVQGKFISAFMLTIVFLILGIGADDIFVLWDAVQQSEGVFTNEEDRGLKQFAWALRRARCAMTVTSSTTFVTLLLAGLSSIPSLSAFGLFGSLVVAFNFLLVITFFPAAIVVHNSWFRQCRGPCRVVNTICGQACGSSEEKHVRLPEKFFRDKWAVWIHRFRLPIVIAWFLLGLAGVLVPALALRVSNEAPKFFKDERSQRYLDVQVGEDFPRTKDDFKVVVYIAMGIDPEEPIDRSGTNYQDKDNIGEPIFNGVGNLVTASGQKTLWDLCEKARAGEFHRVARDEECDTHVVQNPSWGNAGVRIESTSCQTGAVCFIDWVRDFRLTYRNEVVGNVTEENWHEDEALDVTLTSAAFSTNSDHHPAPAGFLGTCGSCCESNGWYICMLALVRSSAGLQDTRDWFDMSKFRIENGELQWAYVGLNSTMATKPLPLQEIEPHYDDWTAFTEANLGPIQGFHTTAYWVWMVTQGEVLKSVLQSVVLCMALAFVILTLATTNWMISSISFLCILLVFFTFAMFITCIGRDLGPFEAIGLIVVIGLSVDYSVHIGHTYNESRYLNGKKASRFEKTQHALTEMGISVVSGAMTTFLASIFLLPALFMFYHVFGIFMLVTVILSTLVALTLLPALLCIIGPEGSQGDIPCLRGAYNWVVSICRLRRRTK